MKRLARSAPALLLLSYGAAFALAAFGGGLPAFDDHPGQFFRLWHALERSLPSGAWTADWNPDWWAGYPELQFYPPGFVLVGAAIRLAGLWRPSPQLTYQLLCGLTLFLPALATFLLLARVLGDRWLALPPAFLALTLSAGLRSGVEESLRWGMLTSRLSLGCLPLLALSLRPWIERGGLPLWAPILIAMVLLAHPASAPAALVIVALATFLAFVRSPHRRTLFEASVVIGLALALTAFWTIPLGARRAWVIPLAWGDFTLAGFFTEAWRRPLLLTIGLGVPVAWLAMLLRRRPFEAMLAALPVALLAVLVGDIWLFARGWSAIEPTRVMDGVVFSALWATGLGVGAFVVRATARPERGPARAVIALAVVLVAAVLPDRTAGEPSLTLWPRAKAWPRLHDLAEAHDLSRLWSALGGTPDRVLFLASSLRLDRDPAWYAPHSHALSLAPLFAKREIIHGTFTHASPLAARFYTGQAVPPPRIRILAEQLDGQRLLGQPWDRLPPETFDAFARRLRVATIVLPTDEVSRARFLGSAYVLAGEASGFSVLERRDRPWPRFERITHRRYRVLISPTGGVWIPTGIPAYPLWQVKSAQGALDTRVDAWGLLEFRIPLDLFEAELVYAEGWIEWSSLALSLAGGVVWLAWIWMGRRRAALSPRQTSARPRRR